MTDDNTTEGSGIREALASTSLSRRSFLVTGGVAGGALLVAACSKDKTTKTSAGATSSTAAKAGATGSASGDATVAALAASLEVLAVGTYGAALEAATAGKLGAVPPAVATFVTTAQSQHQAALDKWNSVLAAANQPAVSEPPEDLKATVDQAFGRVTDATGAAKLALLLEETASNTYLSAIGSLKDKDAITLAGALQSVDQEHAAILHFVLGEYPVPDVFQKTDKAYKG